ncbi:serine hydrolase domain-containing protein [Pedobacter sp.]|uniref:serine hydrolase domain-containing protein n=1 Tax=Pedobacter sp. TaxID=1411316 RepID=UPI003D7FF43A
MKRNLLTSFFVLLLIQSGYSQNFDKVKLDNYFQALEASHKYMGSVAISQDGKIMYTKAIGFKNLEEKVKPDLHTKYRIGSISKTFTAVLLFQAIDENKIILSETILKYFPAIKNADHITIGQLLNHHSGIHNFTDDENYLTWYTQKKSEKEMVAIISKLESDFEPGSKAAYSNSNYVLLSYILQKLYNKPYAQVLDEKIIKPLGLTDTYYGGKIDLSKNESYSYQFKGDWKKEPETDMSIPVGAGSIVSTPSDLTTFAHALFNGKLIEAPSLQQMKTIQDGYGMGLFEVPFNQHKGFHHNGGIDGFKSFFAYFPEGKIAVAHTSNGSNYDNNQISIALLSSIYHTPFHIPDFKTYVIKEKDLDQYLGLYADKGFPMKITISKSGSVLMAQATGQSGFALEPADKDIFKFDPAGIVLQFNPEAKQMTLKQGGKEFVLTKE